MKKLYVKYKILVNGLHTTTPYTIDGFTLKSSTFDKNMFNDKYDENKNGIDFNLNFYLESCFTDFENYHIIILNLIIMKKEKFIFVILYIQFY